MSHLPLDARAILQYLNELGYRNISAEQLKEFMKDLRKLIKYEESLGVDVHQEDYFQNLYKRTTASFRAKCDEEMKRRRQLEQQAACQQKVTQKRYPCSKRPEEPKKSPKSMWNHDKHYPQGGSKNNRDHCREVAATTSFPLTRTNFDDDDAVQRNLCAEMAQLRTRATRTCAEQRNLCAEMAQLGGIQATRTYPEQRNLCASAYPDQNPSCDEPRIYGGKSETLTNAKSQKNKYLNSKLCQGTNAARNAKSAESLKCGRDYTQQRSSTDDIGLSILKNVWSGTFKTQAQRRKEGKDFVERLVKDKFDGGTAGNKENCKAMQRSTLTGAPDSATTTKSSGQPITGRTITLTRNVIIPRRPTRPRKKMSTDPVALYQYYQREWNHFQSQIPGENSRASLRWQIRHKLKDPDRL